MSVISFQILETVVGRSTVTNITNNQSLSRFSHRFICSLSHVKMPLLCPSNIMQTPKEKCSLPLLPNLGEETPLMMPVDTPRNLMTPSTCQGKRAIGMLACEPLVPTREDTRKALKPNKDFDMAMPQIGLIKSPVDELRTPANLTSLITVLRAAAPAIPDLQDLQSPQHFSRPSLAARRPGAGISRPSLRPKARARRIGGVQKESAMFVRSFEPNQTTERLSTAFRTGLPDMPDTGSLREGGRRSRTLKPRPSSNRI